MNEVFIFGKNKNADYRMPKISYTKIVKANNVDTQLPAAYDFIEESLGNWKIRFLESGTLKFLENQPEYLDVFLVGGGSGGSNQRNYLPGIGGSGGFTKRGIIKLSKEENYDIKIGAGGKNGTNGEDSSAFGLIAKGGIAPIANNFIGEGGSGGGGYEGENSNSNDITKVAPMDGASNGNDASGVKLELDDAYAGKGQGFTTREFYETNGKLYAGGGGGATNGHNGIGGEGGGGKGGAEATAGEPNTGGGGGGKYSANGMPGGSGIVVIRNIRYK